MTSPMGSGRPGTVGGFHGVALLCGGRVSAAGYWVLAFSLKDASEEAGGRLLSSQHCSKAEKEPSISLGTSDEQGRCRGVVSPV